MLTHQGQLQLPLADALLKGLLELGERHGLRHHDVVVQHLADGVLHLCLHAAVIDGNECSAEHYDGLRHHGVVVQHLADCVLHHGLLVVRWYDQNIRWCGTI